MIKIYGITSCGSVKKALKFFKDHDLNIEFIDLKKTQIDPIKLNDWIKQSDLTILLNTKGTTYRSLNLKELNLTENDKKEWLLKEQMLFKRPIVEYNNGILVGFDEDKYKTILIKSN